MIPYGHQDISEDDIAEVVRVLRSDFITQGPAIDRFEAAVAERCGIRNAVAVANGTAALHLACLAAELGPDDLLWTSPNTFVASANCARYCGADVDFVDIDPITYNMDPTALEAKLEEASTQNRLPTIVVPVHFAGQSCDMVAIRRLADEYGFLILEDASHAVGGRFRDTEVGSCAHSEMAVFSFHPVKIITTGEGGMVLTNRDDLADRVRLLRHHGITREPAAMSRASDGPWYYEQIDLGYNYRMTDLQAALGLSQLRRLTEFVARRNELARRYDRLLADLPVTTPQRTPDVLSALHLYVVRVDRERVRHTRGEIFETMRSAGVGVQVHYIPVHLQPYYRALGFGPGDFPEAERYYAEALTLPLYPGLTEEEQDKVVSVLQNTLAV